MRPTTRWCVVVAALLVGHLCLCVPALGQAESAQQTGEDAVEAADGEPAAPGTEPPVGQAEAPADVPGEGARDAAEPASEDSGEPPAGETPPAEAKGDTGQWPRPLGEDEVSIQADNVYYRAGFTGAQGNVVAKYRDIVVHADVGEIDEDQIWGEFRGNVVIETPNQRTTATSLRINFDTNQWTVQGASTTIQPQFFQAGVAAPVYVGGATAEAEEGGEPIHVRDGYATTCDLEDPHYALTARELTVLPEDKVILRRPTLEVFGHRVVRYPWDLVLSLRRRQNRFLPTLGQNEVEGYYAKLAYGYLAGEYGEGFARLHLTQKRGIGFGGEHYFEGSSQSGELSLFLEPEMGAYSGRARHSYSFDEALGSDLSLSLQRNSGYSGATNSFSGNLNLRHSVTDSDTSFGFEHSRTDSPYSDSRRYTANLSHRQRLGFDAGWSLQSVWRNSEYGSASPTRETLESNFEYHQRRTHLDWAIAAERRWDMSEEEDEYGLGAYGLDRLPEIVLNTDSRRLDDFEILGRVPVSATLRAGHFMQLPDDTGISMVSLDTNLGGGTTRLGRRAELRTSGSFNQAFYDEGSARYNTGFNATLDNQIGSHWQGRTSYGFGSVHGYSPLRRDYGYRRHDLSLQLVRQMLNRSRVELTTGYDLVDDRYREARLWATFNTSNRTRWELMSGYDIEGSLWRPLQLRWMYAHPEKLYLTMSSRYDLDQSELSSADLELDWRAHRLWRLEAISSFSGYSDDLEHLNLRLTRDLHCWLASLTYSKDLNEFRLGLGLKAFPFEEQDWSLGRSGQRLGSYDQPYY